MPGAIEGRFTPRRSVSRICGSTVVLLVIIAYVLGIVEMGFSMDVDDVAQHAPINVETVVATALKDSSLDERTETPSVQASPPTEIVEKRETTDPEVASQGAGLSRTSHRKRMTHRFRRAAVQNVAFFPLAAAASIVLWWAVLSRLRERRAPDEDVEILHEASESLLTRLLAKAIDLVRRVVLAVDADIRSFPTPFLILVHLDIFVLLLEILHYFKIFESP